MSESEPEAEVVEITVQTNSEKIDQGRKHRRVRVPQNQLEIWDEEAEKRGMDRSSLIRMYAAAGRRMIDKYEPDKSIDENQSPLREAIIDEVPIGVDSATSIEQITESIIDEIENEVWDVLIEDDAINRSGNKFYKQ